jgi:hypothetical protein
LFPAALLLLGTLAFPGSLAAAEIEWLSDFEAAYTRAEEQGRNIFLLVTAPAWCPPCRELEETTLQQQAIIQWINRNFVPLRLEDSNPQHALLDVPAMPSMLVLDSSGGTIAVQSGVPTEAELQSWVTEKSVVLPGSTVPIENGLFHRRSDETWELYLRGETTELGVYDRDDRFVYLRPAADAQRFYAVTTKERAAFAWDGEAERWRRLPPPPHRANDAARP